jgi:uroporphyrinogen decarboxylase
MAYDTVQRMYHLPRQAPRIGTFMTNAVFEEPFIAAVEGDMLLIASPHLCRSPLRGKHALDHWKEQQLWGNTYRVPETEVFKTMADGSIAWETTGCVCPPGGYYFDWPGGGSMYDEFRYDLDGYQPADSFSDEFLRNLQDTAKQCYEETDYSLNLGETVTDLQCQPGGRFGWMVLLKENPDLMKGYLAKAVEASLKQIALLDQAVGTYVDTLLIADDMGDNRGVTIGEENWRDVYKPYYHELFHGWHERTAMKISLHCCGSVYSILDDLLECGLDVLNPVQVSAHGMSPAALKAKCGNRLVFYGGDYDAQLMKGRDYETVYEHVKNNLNTLKQGGGHIFCGVHNLPPDMPEEHLRAFFAAWQANRAY